ncbi:MAG: cytochrome c oxidase, cbb3-type, CcoQ subunit [Thiovulaceae bacterium]|nr:cytochrome c oxidase, cbb3-type, CcoQ subunit [Sulfurimonadaceae bacterium]
MNWEEFAAFGYFFLTAFMVIILYGYIYHLYSSDRKGRRKYEKYSNMALDDEITSEPVEKYEKKEKKEEA